MLHTTSFCLGSVVLDTQHSSKQSPTQIPVSEFKCTCPCRAGLQSMKMWGITIKGPPGQLLTPLCFWRLRQICWWTRQEKHLYLSPSLACLLISDDFTASNDLCFLDQSDFQSPGTCLVFRIHAFMTCAFKIAPGAKISTTAA